MVFQLTRAVSIDRAIYPNRVAVTASPSKPGSRVQRIGQALALVSRFLLACDGQPAQDSAAVDHPESDVGLVESKQPGIAPLGTEVCGLRSSSRSPLR